ncbi:MAG: hypothetical protein GY953_29620, partial [bacterium]|nr:hypothetical protein [bacterium]
MMSVRLILLAACGLLIGSVPVAAQALVPERAEEASASEDTDATIQQDDPEAASERTRLNLLGEINSGGGEGRRNENVRLTLIDNNVLKEINRRMGTTAAITTEFRIEQGYFGKEFGGRPQPSLHLPPHRTSGFHGNVFWNHNNSSLSARSFFQVGDVQPARTNDYGITLGLPLWEGATLTFNGSQRALRGQVNGNVLVPAADERTPLTTDPVKLAIVKAILGAYPDELPNRTDINPRALNTNAPQNIDNDRIGVVVDQALGGKDRLSMRYNFTLQNVEAFQLVGGQNPDTTTRNHQARFTRSRSWSSA